MVLEAQKLAALLYKTVVGVSDHLLSPMEESGSVLGLSGSDVVGSLEDDESMRLG